MFRVRQRAALRRTAVGVLVLAVGLAGCSSPAPVHRAVLTPVDSGCIAKPTASCAAYTYTRPRSGGVVVSAPATASGNEREFFWSWTSPDSADEEACATFASGQGVDQQGIMLRLDKLEDGRVRAVSVTRNVWAHAFNAFNFHVWDTQQPAPGNFTQFGSVVVSDLPVSPAVYPLDMCARTVSATDTLQFVVWRPGQPRPPWGSTTQGGEAALPTTAPAEGRAGWFAGHMSHDTTMHYTGLTVDGSTPKGLS